MSFCGKHALTKPANTTINPVKIKLFISISFL
jgi:hypothetical protein